MAESWSFSISGKSLRVGFFVFLNKAPRHQIHTFQSSLHRKAGILTLIQHDEPENLSTALLSNITQHLKEKRKREQKNKKNHHVAQLP